MRKRSGRTGKLSRRSALALIAGGGLAGLSSVGAFSQVNAGRRFGVSTTTDEDALLGINIPAEVTMPVGSSKELFTLENQAGGQLSVQVESLETWLDIETSVRPPNSETVDTGASISISGTVSAGGSGAASVRITATEIASTGDEPTVSIQATRTIPINIASGSGKFIIGITNKKKVELYQAANSGSDTVTKIFPTNGFKNAGGAVKAIGTISSDIDGDGKPDLVAIKNQNKIMFVDEDGKLKLNTKDDFVSLNSAKADTQKTTLSTGSWKGYDIFYPSKNHDKIYAISQTSSGWTDPEGIVAPGNGVNGILPPADIDNDGIDELVFADGSQQIRYVDKNLNITKVTGGGVGSSNNIGVGPVATIDGRTLMPTVDGSNNIKFLGPPKSGSGTVKKRAVFKGVDAAKSRITVADIDRDGKQEVVYLTNSNQKLRYIDNIDISEGSFDSYDVLYEGSSITGEKKRGVV
ncbi:MAG: hypothetical protein ABEH60_06835 [Halonotius sp.]